MRYGGQLNRGREAVGESFLAYAEQRARTRLFADSKYGCSTNPGSKWDADERGVKNLVRVRPRQSVRAAAPLY